MPALSTINPMPDLERALDASGEKEYRRLLRALRMARGSFFLFPIESDFPNMVRDALLERLRADLAAESVCLRVATVNCRQWDVFALPTLERPVAEFDVVALVGLEDTPGIVPETGAHPVRPPALALLNQQRETLHRRVPAPFLVWCPPYVFTTLMEQAPDFFDHFTSLFRFPNASPQPESAYHLPLSADFTLLPPPIITSPAAAQTAATFYEAQAAQHPAPTTERARALLGLADALMELRGPNYPQHIQRVLVLVEEALVLLSPKRDAYEWARGQSIKGIAFCQLPIGDQTHNLQQSITCYEAALHVYTETDYPYDWAKTLYRLGIAYTYLPTGDRTHNLQQAIACYQDALRVRTKTEFPQEWARTQFNLGNAYRFLPTGDHTLNLMRTIACYEAALHVLTETDFPYDWACTQSNLGVAYTYLPTGDRTHNLQQAIACYQAALRILIEADYPQEWASTQTNLGVTYRELHTDHRTQNLMRAINCYEAALCVHNPNEYPREWVATQLNLALAQQELGNRAAARQALHYAIAGYRQVGLETEAERAENLLRQLDAE